MWPKACCVFNPLDLTVRKEMISSCGPARERLGGVGLVALLASAMNSAVEIGVFGT